MQESQQPVCALPINIRSGELANQFIVVMTRATALSRSKEDLSSIRRHRGMVSSLVLSCARLSEMEWFVI